MNGSKFLAILVPLFLVITLAFNGIAASGALNGITTGEISDKYPVLFTPASYVFSIWSVIYLSLTAFSIYQLLPSNFKEKSIDPIRSWFIISSILNSLWIVIWQYEYVLLSLPVMILLLTSLISIYLTISKLNRKDQNSRWFLSAPFSLYLGWISVATIANTSVVLYVYNWNQFGLSDVFWTITVMLAAVGLGVLKLKKFKDYIYAGVIVWALIGIAVKNSVNWPIQLTTIFGICALAYVSLCSLRKAK